MSKQYKMVTKMAGYGLLVLFTLVSATAIGAQNADASQLKKGKTAPSGFTEDLFKDASMKTAEGYELTVGTDVVNKVLSKDKTGDIIVSYQDEVSVTLPINAIDFEQLYNELGEYKLTIKLNTEKDDTLQLQVMAHATVGSYELTDFNKVVTVTMQRNYEKESKVYRQEGETFVGVPYRYTDTDYEIEMVKSGNYIWVSDSNRDRYKTVNEKTIKKLKS